MTPRLPGRLTAVAVTTAALAVTAACGSSYSTAPPRASPQDRPSCSVLIGSSGDAETKAVTAAARLGEQDRQQGHRHPGPGHQASSSARASPAGNPPDVFYVDAATVRRTTRRPATCCPTATRSRQGRLLPEPASTRSPTRASCTARRRTSPPSRSDQHRRVEEGRSHRRRHPDDLGPAGGGREEADDRQAGRSGDRRHPRPDRRVHGAGRRLDHERGRHDGDRGHPRRTCRRCSTSSRCSTTGVAKYPKQLDAGWAGEAFGKQKAAMTIEGNWILGAHEERLPERKYTVVQLPAGPTGQGHAVVHQLLGHRGPQQAPGRRRSTSSKA